MGWKKDTINREGEIHECKDEKFQIIRDYEEYSSYGYKLVRIRFLDTGYESDEYYETVIQGKGKPRDPFRIVYDNRNTIFHSKNFGDYKIIDIDEEASKANDRPMVIVRFIKTGYTYTVPKVRALKGSVKDPTLENQGIIGQTFHSISGDYIVKDFTGEVLEISGILHKIVRIKFIRTGNEYNVIYYYANIGYVFDTLTGDKEIPNYMYIYQYLYSIHNEILNISNNSGIFKVSNSWIDVNVFIDDVKHLPGYPELEYNTRSMMLDLHILQSDISVEQRIYSKNTCIWIPMDIYCKFTSGEIAVNKYYDNIYEINGLYYIKPFDGSISLGPFSNIQEALLYKNKFNDYPNGSGV